MINLTTNTPADQKVKKFQSKIIGKIIGQRLSTVNQNTSLKCSLRKYTKVQYSNVFANEEEGTVSQNTTVIFGGAFYLG
jgi:hypothetical protein